MSEEFFGKGKRGDVFLRKENGRTVLVKRKRAGSVVDTIANEARYTKLLNEHGVGPRFIRYDAAKNELVREYVKGVELRKWLPTATRSATKNVLRSVLLQCKALDDARVNKLEMTRPWKHIILTAKGAAVLIDFERCTVARVPKNVTQYCQFLSGKRLTATLAEKKIVINARKLLELSKIYKQSIRDNNQRLQEKTFSSMVELVKKA